MLKEILKKASKDATDTKINKMPRLNHSNIIDQYKYLDRFLNNCREGPDVFAWLSRKSCIYDIHLRIPETLVYTSHGNNPIFLYNGPDGYIKAENTGNSVDAFFNAVETIFSTDNRDGLPMYLHISKGTGSKLYFNTNKAKKNFEECPYRHHILQRYIRVGSKKAWKVYVSWEDKRTKYYTLTNNTEFTAGLNKSSQDVVSHQSLFTPFKTFQKISSHPASQDPSAFMIKFKNKNSYHIVMTLHPIKGLKNIVNQFIPTLKKLLFKNKNIKEIVLEFIKESKDIWYFLGIKGYSLKGDAKNINYHKNMRFSITENRKKYPSISILEPNTPTSEELSKITTEKLEINEISKYSKNLMKRVCASSSTTSFKISSLSKEDEYYNYLSYKKADNLGRVPYNMIGITPQRASAKITHFIDTRKKIIPLANNSTDFPLGMHMVNEISVKSNAAYLQEVSKSLDQKLSHVIATKKKKIFTTYLKKIIEKIGNLDSLFLKFLSNLKNSGEFYLQFENLSQFSIEKIAKGYSQMINGKISKKQIQKIHENLFVTNKNFSVFLSILETTISAHYLIDSKFIIEKFISYQEDLVNDNL
jgi:hypothetical protein